MPVLLQPSQVAFGKQARGAGCGVHRQDSQDAALAVARLYRQGVCLRDFLFKDPDTGARDRPREGPGADARDDRHDPRTGRSNTTPRRITFRNGSIPGLFPLASSIRQYNKSQFASVEEHRRAGRTSSATTARCSGRASWRVSTPKLTATPWPSRASRARSAARPAAWRL